MKNSELRTRAKELALKIISVCDSIDTKKGRGVLVNQIVRSATSMVPTFMKQIMLHAKRILLINFTLP